MKEEKNDNYYLNRMIFYIDCIFNYYELMKNKNGLQEKVVNFIKNADLYMDNFEYLDINQIQFDVKTENEKPVIIVKSSIPVKVKIVYKNGEFVL